MDFKTIFTPKTKIFGVTISDSKISLSLLKEVFKKPKKREFLIKKIKEIDLPQGVVEKGRLKDKKALEESFKKLLLDFFSSKRKIPKIIPSIVSFPVLNSFFQVFDFPDKITYDKLEESLKLQFGFSLPIDINECYLDWELLDPTEKKVLLGVIRKEIVDSYLEVFEKLPLFPIVLEPFSFGLARILSLEDRETFCFVFLENNYLEIGIVKNESLKEKEEILQGSVRFLQGYWLEKEDFQRIEDYVFRAINFYESDEIDSGIVKRVYLIGKEKEISLLFEQLKKNKELEIVIPKIPFKFEEVSSEININDNSLILGLGTSLRGFIPRQEDNFISLLPVGTEEGREKTDLISFLDFLKTTSFLLFFILFIIFGSTYFVIKQYNKIYQNELNTLAMRSEAPFLQNLKKIAQDFNKSVDLMEKLEKDRFSWSPVFEKIKEAKNEGITLTEIYAFDPAQEISVRGIAQKREDLLVFKENLERLEVFKDIYLPPKLLEKKENILFSIRFRIK